MRNDALYAQVASVLLYDPDTGAFTWGDHPLATPKMRGRVAGFTHVDGYVYIRFCGKRLLAHRIAWLKHYGYIPPDQIDHINMCRSDNRISNLRLASIAENNRNKIKQANNTSGFKGVTFHKSTGKWNARICVDKRRTSLGYFLTVYEAAAAYSKAMEAHHGEFARSA